MKRLLLLTVLLLLPLTSFAAIAAPWNASSTDRGYITPNLINGNVPNVYASGSVAIGSSTPTVTPLLVSRQSGIQVPISGSIAQFVGSDNNPLRITFDTNNTTTSGTAFMFRNSGGTAASPSATILNAVLGSLNFRGYGTTGYAAGSTALMTAKAEAAFTDTSMPTAITFDTTYTNSVTAAERLRIAGSGAIGIGSTSPFAKLSINANPNDPVSFQILFAIGSSTATATTTLFSVSNTGLASTTNLIVSGIANGSTQCAQIAATGLLSGTGSACGSGGGTGLSTSSPVSASNLLVYSSVGAGSAYGVATSSVTINSPLSGTLTGIGAGQSLSLGTVGIANGGTGTTTSGIQGQNWIVGPAGVFNATSTLFTTTASFVGIGTTSPWAKLSVHSDLLGSAPAFVVGSSSVTSFVVTNGGNVGIGSSSPMSTLAINGLINQYGSGPIHFGGVPNTDLYCTGSSKCLSFTDSDNTSIGVSAEVQNISSGSTAYSAWCLGNNKTDQTGTFYSCMQLNSGTYSDTLFGSAFAVPSLLSINTNQGAVQLWSASTSATGAYVNIGAGGTDAGHEIARFKYATGPQVGIGSTSPGATLGVNAASSSPTGPIQLWSYSTGSTNSATTTIASMATSTVGGISFGTTSPAALIAFNVDSIGSQNAFLLGSTTKTYLQVNNAGAIFAPNTASSGSAQTGYWCYDGNGQFIRDTAVCLVSDIRAKDVSGSFTSALGEINQLNPILYTYKAAFNGSFQDNPNYTRTHLGFSAQDLQKINPNLVDTYTEDGSNGVFSYKKGEPKGPDTYALVTLALEGVKEQQKEIANIRAGKSPQDMGQDVVIGLLVLYILYTEVKKRKV